MMGAPPWYPSRIALGAVQISFARVRRVEVRKAGVVLLLVGVSAVVFLAIHELRIDSCLDEGGSWNYDQGKCNR